jgi:hypothetical protein
MMQFFCSIILLQIHYKYIILFSAQQTTNKQKPSLSISMAQVPENNLSMEQFLKKYRPYTFARTVPRAPIKAGWRKLRAIASTRGRNLSGDFALAETVPGAPKKAGLITSRARASTRGRNLSDAFACVRTVPRAPKRRRALKTLNPLLKRSNLYGDLGGALFVTRLSADR